MFTERLKLLRKERSLTQTEFAKQIRASQNTVSNWENGNRVPDSDTLITLANFFNCSVDYLLGRTEYRVDDELLDVVNELDPEMLAYYGNIHDALRARYSPDNALTPVELEYIKKYRALDEHGVKAFTDTLELEYLRSIEELNDNNYRDIGHWLYPTDLDCPANAIVKRLLIPRSDVYRKVDFAINLFDVIVLSEWIHEDDIVLLSENEVGIGGEGLFELNGKLYIGRLMKEYIESEVPEIADIHFTPNDDFKCYGKIEDIYPRNIPVRYK